LEGSAAKGSQEQIGKALSDTEKEAQELLNTFGKFDDIDDDIRKVVSEIEKLEESLSSAKNNKSEIDKVAKNTQEQIKILNKLSVAKEKAAEDEIKLQARIEKANIRSRKLAERNLKAQIKAFPKVKNELAELADKYDGLIVPIGNVNRELDEQQKEVLALIRSDERLVEVVERLTKETGQFNLELKRTDFKKPSQGMQGMTSALGGFSKLIKGGVILAGLREIARVALRVAEQVGRAFVNVTTEIAKIADLILVDDWVLMLRVLLVLYYLLLVILMN
jgi:chromosome segregation ATPase